MAGNLKVDQIQGAVMLAAKAKLANALDIFRPTKSQEHFFLNMGKDDIIEMLLGGGNRSGKSLSAAVAITAILLNKPVIFNDGTKHYLRPQRWRDESIKVWIVSYDWKHTGKTIFRLLFKEGAFRMVRDPATNKWRAWNPTNPEEPPRNKTKKCPPLIRFSDIKGGEHGISYENAKEFQISSCEFEHDGTRLECFASTGKRPQGDPANLIWIDEKIADEGWYNELMSRTIDDQGRIMWTAWPDTAPSDAMTAIADRAKEQEGKPNQFSYSIELDGDDNPFTKSQHRDNVFSTMDEESRNARAHGILNKDRWRIYSRFSEYVHTALKTDPTTDDDLAKSIREVNGIPATWTRYLILDPGTVNPAVLFVAVPPPSLGDYIVPYDELYLHNTPAKPLSEAIAARTKGTYFEDFIADSHACRMTPMGFDGRVGENYEKEFARVGLLSRRHGARFTYGSDNVAGRILRLQGNLNLETRQNNDGKMTQNPRLRVMIAACPILVKQLKAYKRGKDINNNPIEEPAKYQAIDMAQCAEYFCSRDDLGYHAPVALRNEDPKSRDVVMKTLGGIFGRTPSVKTQSQSVYCGSGEVSEYM